MRGIGLTVAATLLLAGCAASNGAGTGAVVPRDAEARALGVVAQVGRILGGIRSDDNELTAPPPGPDRFTPQAIAAEPGAYRLVQINALGLQEPARVVQANGDEVTLALQSGPTAAYDGGVLVATRGFGDDLMTLESRGVLESLRAGGGSVSRRMETLDAQDQLVSESVACTIAPAGSEEVDLGLRTQSLRRFDENCRGRSVIFDNIYWLDGSGRIISSRQYVSPTVAYLRSNAL